MRTGKITQVRVVAWLWVAAWGWVFAEEIIAAATLWLSSEAYNHSLLVPPIIALWLYSSAYQVLPAVYRYPWLLLAVPVILGWWAGVFLEINLVRQLAVVLLLVTVGLFVYGGALIARAWFPLGLLFFMVPVGDEIVPLLQEFTAAGATEMLRASGYALLRTGLYLDLPGGTYWVAEACAGLKFLVATLFFGYCLAYLYFSTWRGRILFMLLCAAIPIPANMLRVYLTIVVGEYFGIDSVAGFDHIVYGWVLFALIFLFIAFVAHRFGRVEITLHRRAPEWGMPELSAHHVTMFVPLLVVALLASVAGGSQAQGVVSAAQVDSLQARYAATEAVGAGPAVADADVRLQLRVGEQLTGYYIGFDRAEGEILSLAHRLVDPNAQVLVDEVVALTEQVSGRVQHLRLHNGREQWVCYWFQVGADGAATVMGAKLLQAQALLLGGEPPVAAAGVFMDAQYGVDAQPDARQKLEAAAAQLAGQLASTPMP